MYKKRVSVVITDLDNTLYDWVEIWYRPFRAMLDRVIADTGIPEETLIQEIKVVHERHGTSEYSYMLEELPSLQKYYAGRDIAKECDGAIHDYRSARRKVMRMYPGVMETLQTLKEYGCLIVGYTESMEFYSNYRIRNLNLDGILDVVYYPPDHEFPQNITREQLRLYPKEHYELKVTKHECTPKGVLKPNAELLIAIIRKLGAKPDEVIYIGDSLMKDVEMAKRAGATDVYAKYGFAQDRPEYELLRKVTHWPDNHVSKEKAMDEAEVKPTYTLECSLSEILALFKFVPFLESPVDPYMSSRIEVWKETVDVQQHFNDLELRIRSYALTAIAAILTVAAVCLEKGLEVTAFKWEIPTAGALTILALIILGAFYLMDRHWYHCLLMGAVEHGTAIEKSLEGAIPQIALTQAISKASPTDIKIRIKKRERKLVTVHSKGKMKWFYGIIALGLLLMTFFIMQGSIRPVASKTPQSSGKQTVQDTLSQDSLRSQCLPDSTKSKLVIQNPSK